MHKVIFLIEQNLQRFPTAMAWLRNLRLILDISQFKPPTSKLAAILTTKLNEQTLMSSVWPEYVSAGRLNPTKRDIQQLTSRHDCANFEWFRTILCAGPWVPFYHAKPNDYTTRRSKKPDHWSVTTWVAYLHSSAPLMTRAYKVHDSPGVLQKPEILGKETIWLVAISTPYRKLHILPEITKSIHGGRVIRLSKINHQIATQ